MKNGHYKSRFSFDSNLFREMALKQWKMLLALGVFLWIGAVGIPYSQAATFHVNCQSGTPDGSNGFYSTISTAVSAAAANDIIRVHAGSTCEESVTINVNKTGLRIMGDNPSNTKVIHTPALASVNVFTVSASSVEIAGLTITGSGNGIYINSVSASIHNNHINYNKANGIYTAGNLGDAGIVFNNIIKGNTLDGIYCSTIGTGQFAHSNIITENGNYALSSGVDNYAYNSTYKNKYNASIALGIGNIQQDCLFVNESANPPDFRLQNTSPCKNTGNTGYLDADGTRPTWVPSVDPALPYFGPMEMVGL
ncbi:MAG: hypothetical protein A2132_03770 [Nitrospirae bacterium RBG_16_43_11]|nr:MAG: hypothetical protein A2132_03770 [Nitrospirae bacterium RBG_16_43_11]